jgi:hypothetical protein
VKVFTLFVLVEFVFILFKFTVFLFMLYFFYQRLPVIGSLLMAATPVTELNLIIIFQVVLFKMSHVIVGFRSTTSLVDNMNLLACICKFLRRGHCHFRFGVGGS